MTTKAEFRELLRRTLEDTSVSAPLWDDATLDDATTEALARYGAIAPLEQRTNVSISGGASQIVVTGLDSGRWIVAVRDPSGRLIEPVSSDDQLRVQGWRWWDGAIELVLPAAGGAWVVDWRAPRLLPAVDTDPMPIRDGDESAVAAFAAARMLRRYAVEESKRGARGGEMLLALAQRFDRDGERLAHGRGRHLRGTIAIGRHG